MTIRSRTMMIVSAGLLLTGLLSGVTLAQTPAPTQLTEDQKLQLTERAAQRKTAAKTKLTAAQERKIKTACAPAQGKVSAAVTRATAIQANRTKIHDSLLARLSETEKKIATAQVDTAELTAQIASLREKITIFQTDSAAYIQALNDTKDLNCASDPAGFKASLEAARAGLPKVQADAVAVRTHISDNIKPVLATLKVQLAAKQGEN